MYFPYWCSSFLCIDPSVLSFQLKGFALIFLVAQIRYQQILSVFIWEYLNSFLIWKHSFAGYRILGWLSARRICHPTKGYGRFHKSACHPYTAAVILFSVSFWFYYTCCRSSHSASLQTTRGMRETGGKNLCPSHYINLAFATFDLIYGSCCVEYSISPRKQMIFIFCPGISVCTPLFWYLPF